ncbi:translation initiation factor 2 [Streptomyces lincolnensis]|uniref:translation initiation factor 2 n=1 Tax=Streptomyces lincolnensis TaxID=1915 RepID=UPI0022B263E3|nr:translation initiation factor 2 [Streptomyces lincolnensis]
MRDGRRATGDGRRATGDGRRATGEPPAVLFAARSQNALHRLLDTLPVFAGDDRLRRWFTLVPGSDFSLDALDAIERAGGRTIPWSQATARTFALVLAAGPKGDLHALRGPQVLLPHGAGFSKSIPGEGTDDSASGLDPAHLLLPDGTLLADLYAFAHPGQISRLAALSPAVAARAKVVGDPLLERFLDADSTDRRHRYRAALRTGSRRLIVLLSTWGPESLLRRRPSLPAELAAVLPYDEYQLALVVHPNERVRLGGQDLEEHLEPARRAGLILPAAYEEWASVAVAADLLVSDHGSAALYAAALDRPLLGAYDGGDELLPGSPMATLLARVPRLGTDPAAAPRAVAEALRGHRPGSVRPLTDTVFAQHGHGLERLREELYALLGLEPPALPVRPRPLPDPSPPPTPPSAFAVRVRHEADGVIHVTRYPAHLVPSPQQPVHHLTAETDRAGTRDTQGAALLYRRADGPIPAHGDAIVRTADAWTRRTLEEHPGGRRTAAVAVSATHCLLRIRTGPLLSARIEPCPVPEGLVYADPAAVLSAVYTALLAAGDGPPPDSLTCAIGDRRFAVRLSPASSDEAALPV